LENNDPDKLQLLDETNTEWVKRWKKAAKKKKTAKLELTLKADPLKKANTLKEKAIIVT
jgi:hypothetical protein